jgi:hypothetical protein
VGGVGEEEGGRKPKRTRRVFFITEYDALVSSTGGWRVAGIDPLP